MKKVILCTFIAMLFSAAGILLIIPDSLFNFIPALIVLALGFIMWFVTYFVWTSYMGAKNTKKYEQLGNTGKELIERVKATQKANAILDDISFAQEGLQLIVITDLGKNNEVEWPIIVTKDCVYEDWISSYSIPTDAKIIFTAGSEHTVTRHTKMNTKRSAAFGYMVGGLGAAAYNASKAAEINAAGGISSTVKTGSYPIYVHSFGGNAQVRYTIVNNSVIASLPKDLQDSFLGDVVKATEGFTLFKLDLYSAVFSHEIAGCYNKLLAHMANKSTADI